LAGVFFGSTSIADVDGDQNKDLLITGFGESNATLYLGDGEGGFSKANAGLTGVARSATSIADADGDGNQDLLITGFDGDNPTATLYLGDGEGGFSEANAGLTGVGFSSTSIADVDGDGNRDLLITGSSANSAVTATLYLGDGQGGFSEAGAGLAGVRFSSTSTADVDGDGNPDLLITGEDANFDPTATLYLGDGQGGFSEANAGLTGVGGSFVGGSTSIADVDGDGNPDLLITGLDANFDRTATLYLGDGQGGFNEANAGLTGVKRSSTSIADIGGDDDLDLLITGRDVLFGLVEPSTRIYTNRQNQSPPNRAPTFARDFSYDRPLAPGVTLRRTIEAGDLDGDPLSIQLTSGPSNVTVNDRGNGTAEVVFTPDRNQGGDVYDISVEVSDSEGATESFSAPVEVSPLVAAFSAGLTGVERSSTSIADVDGDGNQDLLITGEDANSDPSATLHLGDGQGGFSKANANLSGVENGSASIADVDGDGNQDLLITGPDASDAPTATLYLGDGQGGFSEANANLSGVENSSASIADVDGDGNQDLLITGWDGSNPTATLYLGDGQGGFAEAGAGLSGIRSGSTSIADIDGDGNKDLLIAGSDASDAPTATLYLGDGQGGFSEANANLSGTKDSSTLIADVDGDGNLDLLITGEDANFNPTATLYLGYGQGGFTEANAGLTGVHFGSSAAIADVDGDGNKDLLITGFDGDNLTATLYLGDGESGFSEANAGLTGVSLGSVSIADVDEDEDPDLLITGASAASGSASSIVYENLFDDPLPVELAGLDATADGEKVHLTWRTASETGNARFEVQRKASQQGSWTRVGSVEGSGTTTEAQSYRFTDGDLPYDADALTYRLKQVDTDGSASHSRTVAVDRSVAEIELPGTYPNPARSQATVRYAFPEKKEVSLRLYDTMGRQVRTVAQGKQEGRHKRRVDLSNLSSGVYFLRLRAGQKTKTRRMTVVR